jgi:hypothetical protein
MKIILEATQVLCTVLVDSGGVAPYKPTHRIHPITKWAAKSLSNWLWIRDFVAVLNEENRYRYGKDHKSALVARELPLPSIPDIGFTGYIEAFPDRYKCGDVVKGYRKYYLCEKMRLFKWTNRPVPYWAM